MSSRSWGPGYPAGVSGDDGRGTAGADALPGRISPLLWVMTAMYVGLTAATVWLAFQLAPWGLLLLIVAAILAVASWVAGLMAYGITCLEDEELA